MKQIAKSLLLNVPINIAYEATRNVDSSRYTSDLGGSKAGLSQDIPNTLLVYETRGSWGAWVKSEVSFRKISDSSTE
jgi:hypothetical protein